MGKLLFESLGKLWEPNPQGFANGTKFHHVQHSLARLVFADKRLRQTEPLRDHQLGQACLSSHLAEQILQTLLFASMY